MLNQLNLMCSKCSPYLGSLRVRNNWERISSLMIAHQQGSTYSSKVESTPSSESTELTLSTPKESSVTTETSQQTSTIPYFSGLDIRDMDPEVRDKIHNVSAQVAAAQSATLIPAKRLLKRRNILRMDESEYAGYAILQAKAPLLDRRGEGESYFFRVFEPRNKRNNVDVLATLQADIDMRPQNIRRWLAKVTVEDEIKTQMYNPKRNSVLGNDLAAAHFIVFRKGKVKFLGHKSWVTTYRKDAEPGTPEEDLPVMSFELCSLPTKYDPRYRVEALDCTGVSLHYEGLDNFENLQYVKWISLRDSPHMDDWCMDRLSRIFHETLEFIDLSGCKNVTDRGIGAFHKCKNLKGIMVENMSHLENLEIVCAMLEDHNPNLQILGVDYSSKTEQLRLEGEELEKKALLESKLTNTLAIEPGSGAGSVVNNANLQLPSTTS